MNFEAFAAAHGVLVAPARGDGVIHRCPTSDRPRARNGAYRWTGEWGWIQNWREHAEPVIYRPDHVSVEVVRRDMERERELETARREQAARKAAEIVARCPLDVHPYLARKGFAGMQGLVDGDSRLVVPMRDVENYARINSVQWIAADGEKKFLPGGKAKGSVLIRGAGSDHWLVEGFATGLSIEAALASMYRQSRVVICFSASNLAYVAGRINGRRYVIADNDASGTGERYAAATGLPWAMPGDVGTDANDLHQTAGVRAVVALMRKAMQGGRM